MANTLQRRGSTILGGALSKQSWVTAGDRVSKPWGHEVIFALVPDLYCGKILHINDGCALSLQFHETKDETIWVQSGTIHFEVGQSTDDLESFDLLPGEGVRLAPKTIHRLTAKGDAVVLEASTTQLDDVVRLLDMYGRISD